MLRLYMLSRSLGVSLSSTARRRKANIGIALPIRQKVRRSELYLCGSKKQSFSAKMKKGIHAFNVFNAVGNEAVAIAVKAVGFASRCAECCRQHLVFFSRNKFAAAETR